MGRGFLSLFSIGTIKLVLFFFKLVLLIYFVLTVDLGWVCSAGVVQVAIC